MAQGSTGNVIAALASFFIPGLGQLIQGRVMMATFYFLLNLLLIGIFFAITLGVGAAIGHGIGILIATVDAALWRGRISRSL
jgi:TM2 domain-containing membrane protein YozV